MKTPHQDFQKAKEELIDLLKHHEAVLAFQEAEKAIGQIPQISSLAGQMKADLIQNELENLPIVQDYRQKMQDASDLIQYVTKSIEEKINEELRHG